MIVGSIRGRREEVGFLGSIRGRREELQFLAAWVEGREAWEKGREHGGLD